MTGVFRGGTLLAYSDGLIAMSFPDAPQDGTTYGRLNGVWVPVLPLVGGALTGPLSVSTAGTVPLLMITGTGDSVAGQVVINDPSAAATAFGSYVTGERQGNKRWEIGLGDGAPESSGNAGTNFAVNRFSDAGSFIDVPLAINRASGQVALNQSGLKTAATGVFCGGRGVGYNQYGPNFIAFQWGSPSFTVWVDNNNVGTVTPVVSDVRLKENVAPATADALAELNALELISYDLPDRVDPTQPAKHFAAGFSAQQMQPIIPEAVHDMGDTLSLDTLPLLARCVGAIQQLTAQLQEAMARIEALEAKLA